MGIAAVAADEAYPKAAYPAAYPKSYDYAPMPYNFAYAVNDAPSYNDFGHQESSDGKVVSGSYNVVLPDGLLRPSLTPSMITAVTWPRLLTPEKPNTPNTNPPTRLLLSPPQPTLPLPTPPNTKYW